MKTMNIEKVSDKIQKLFRLAGNNPYPEEAQAALLKAQKLIAEYNLHEEDFTGEQKENYKHDLIISKVSKGHFNNQIAGIIANAFACKSILIPVRSQYKLAFFGREENAIAAKEALNFAYTIMRKKGNDEIKKAGYAIGQKGSTIIYNAYAQGFIAGLRDAIGAQTRALAIIIPQDTENAFNQKFPGAKRARTRKTYLKRDEEIKTRGYQDGNNVMNQRSLSDK